MNRVDRARCPCIGTTWCDFTPFLRLVSRFNHHLAHDAPSCEEIRAKNRVEKV